MRRPCFIIPSIPREYCYTLAQMCVRTYVCTLEITDLASVRLASVYKIFCIYLYVGGYYATSGADPQLKNLFVGQLQLL